MRDYKQLKIWQKADKLAKEIYFVTRDFPKDELFSLTSQLWRASLAVPTNIVEGFYRSKKEFSHFLVISMGSLKETEYLMSVAFARKYIGKPQYEDQCND